MRILLIFILLAVLFLIPFLFWGDWFEQSFSGDAAVRWLRDFGAWAWAAAVLLLVLDLALPVPSTAVIGALGLIYGPFVGGLVGSFGSILAGAAAYALCRALGRRAAERIAGVEDLRRGEEVFSSVGGWVVALSRCLPLFPEVVACMAGLARMPLRPFLTALACGSLPMAFVFAAVGSLGVERPTLCLALSAAIPVVLWPLAQWALIRRRRSATVRE